MRALNWSIGIVGGLVLLACLAFVLAMVGAYNDIGPVRFVGGYPGFPGAAPPGGGYRANPSSAQQLADRGER